MKKFRTVGSVIVAIADIVIGVCGIILLVRGEDPGLLDN